MREADVPGRSQRRANWRALAVRATASAILLCCATRVEAQFKVPAIPGWTDTSPGVTLGPLPALSLQQLTALRGDSIVASGIDLRDPSAVFRPNFTVLVISGAMPLTVKSAGELADSLRSRTNAPVRSARVVTRPGLPRLRADYEPVMNGTVMRQVMHVIACDTHTAFVGYTFPREVSEAAIARADAHAASIGRDPSFVAQPAELPKKGTDLEALLATGARNGNIAMMRAALSAGADIDNAEQGLMTPLGWAAMKGQVGAVDFLLRNGAGINLKYGLPRRTPLHEAALRGHLEVVQLLAESGADINARNKEGRTALFYATTPPAPHERPANADEIGAYLISKGAVKSVGAASAPNADLYGELPLAEAGVQGRGTPAASAAGDSPFAAVLRLWSSPDGRWAAAFPGKPERVDLQAGGAAGDGYRLIAMTPDGPVLYFVTLMGVDAMSERPLAVQVRDILTMSTDAYVRSAGGNPATLKTKWSTFGKGLPRLEHQFSSDREGVAFETVGFFTMVGVEIVRVNVSYPSILESVHRPSAMAFLQSFVMAGRPELSVAEYARRVAGGAGGVEGACDARLEPQMRAGVEEQGGTHLGVLCFALSASVYDSMRSLDRSRAAMQRSGKAQAWVDGVTGGKRQVELYLGDGIGWWLAPAQVAGRAELVVQLMR